MSATEEKPLAFIGLGAMGMGMATNLLKTFKVRGFDVYQPTLDKFVAAGGQAASTPRSAVVDSKYVVVMVATAAQTLQALFDDTNGAVHELQPNATVILCSTAYPEHVPEVRKILDEKYNRSDVELVDAPVSGGTIRAAQGTLTILASGPPQSIEAARPVLEAMAEPLYVINGGLGAGTKVKMVHQALAAIHITMASEAMGFAAFLGLNTKDAFEYLSKSPGASWMLQNRGPHMLENNLHPFSALNIIVKDVGIVTSGGRNADCPLFLSSAAEQVLNSGVIAGYGLEDDSGLLRVYLPSKDGLVYEQATAPNTSSDDPKLKLVEDILAGVHLAAAVEAMVFGKKIGLDPELLYEIVKGAAGASAMFTEKVPAMISGKSNSQGSIKEVVAKLKVAVEEASRLKYPLHLTATALQLFQLAAATGSADDPDVSIAKIWDSRT
ncbi:hypothetical protein CJF32_00005815 [Rutstroemia sp. NJR-2017a WRK4]|nr:hypothetical protein CJF32_00005815 [Rutstroemia sp. NJR-2017a WRK4]